MNSVIDAKQTVREYKKQLVLDAAGKLFREHGFQKTTLDDIALALGVTKPFIYTYFKNKQTILVELFDNAYVALYEVLMEALKNRNGSPTERLVRFIRIFVESNIDQREFTPILIAEEKHLEPERIRKTRKKLKEFDSRLADLLRDGIKAGEFDISDPEIASLAISGMVRWTHRWYSPSGRLGREQLCDEMIELVLNMVKARQRKASADHSGSTKTGAGKRR